MFRRVLAVALATAVACATAARDSPFDSNGNDKHDAPRSIDGPNRNPDAPTQSDAPSGNHMATLSETTNSTLGFGSNCCSIACSVTATGNTHDNQWYRAFQLSDFPMVTGAFHITSVTFGVQEAGSAGKATVKVHSYSGALDVATLDKTQFTQLAMATATVPDTAGPPGEMVMVPITADIPAGGKFVIAVEMPDLDPSSTKAAGFFMFLGANKSGETHPGYIGSTKCTVSPPEKTATASAGAGQIIIDVNGTY
jgi:hypothetical protein